MPTGWLLATPVKVATPLLLVVVVPALVPLKLKLTVTPETGWPVTDEISVAVSVAAPPCTALPEMLFSAVVAGLTTRFPLALVAALLVSPA